MLNNYKKKGDFFDLIDIKNLFDDFNPPDNSFRIDWINLIKEISQKDINSVGCIHFTEHAYCDCSKFTFNAFEFYWRYSHYSEHLIKKLNNPYFDIIDYIKNFANIIGINDEPYMSYDNTFFYFENSELKVAYEVLLINPFDENDDGVQFLAFEGMNNNNYITVIDEYFSDRYLNYLHLPDELRKPLSKMTDDELNLIKIYLI